VCRGVARHPNTPVEALLDLVHHESFYVRWGIAQNLDTPADVLSQLIHDDHRMVCETVGRHPNLPINTICRLISDEDPAVREAAQKNPNLPEYVRVMITLAHQDGACCDAQCDTYLLWPVGERIVGKVLTNISGGARPKFQFGLARLWALLEI